MSMVCADWCSEKLDAVVIDIDPRRHRAQVQLLECCLTGVNKTAWVLDSTLTPLPDAREVPPRLTPGNTVRALNPVAVVDEFVFYEAVVQQVKQSVVEQGPSGLRFLVHYVSDKTYEWTRLDQL